MGTQKRLSDFGFSTWFYFNAGRDVLILSPIEKQNEVEKMAKVTIQERFLSKADHKGDGKTYRIAAEISPVKGRFGNEYPVIVESLAPSGNGSPERFQTSLWQTHINQLIKLYGSDDTLTWIGKLLHLSAVDIVNADGKDSLGWVVDNAETVK